jgi:hypothetical protein
VELFLGFAAAWVLLYATAPLLLVLPHELGHALTALAVGAPHAEVNVGLEPRPIRLRVGRLALQMRLLNRPRYAWFGFVQTDLPGAGRGARIAVAAAGPIVSLLLVAAWTAASLSMKGSFLGLYFAVLGLAAFISFLATAIPLRYGRLFGPYDGHMSDGYRIRTLLRQA